MTPHGRETLRVLRELEQQHPDKAKTGFTATEIMVNCEGLPDRLSPVMTVSSYLTHLKREGFVERRSSSDKTIAWWRTTTKGKRKKLDAAQA